jgi:hypothetical protein
MTTKTLLKQARALIEDPKHWCTGAYAKVGRHPVAPTHSDADRWCAIGAVCAIRPARTVRRDEAQRLLSQAVREVAPDSHIHSILGLNDADTIPRRKRHKLVLKAYDRAIEVA